MPKRVGSSEVKHDELDGAARAEAAVFEGADGFEAAEDADGAVVHAGVRDGVDVGAGGDGGEVGFGAEPADEDVADGVVAYVEVFGGGEFLEPGASAEVVGREDDAGDGGAVAYGLFTGEGGEDLELVEEAGGVDLELRGLNLARQGLHLRSVLAQMVILDQRMAVPVFINEVFCGALADGSEPLGAVGAHPDEIACGDWVPVVAEAVDAAAFEHEEAVLHDVDFDLA